MFPMLAADPPEESLDCSPELASGNFVYNFQSAKAEPHSKTFSPQFVAIGKGMAIVRVELILDEEVQATDEPSEEDWINLCQGNEIDIGFEEKQEVKSDRSKNESPTKKVIALRNSPPLIKRMTSNPNVFKPAHQSGLSSIHRSNSTPDQLSSQILLENEQPSGSSRSSHSKNRTTFRILFWAPDNFENIDPLVKWTLLSINQTTIEYSLDYHFLISVVPNSLQENVKRIFEKGIELSTPTIQKCIIPIE